MNRIIKALILLLVLSILAACSMAHKLSLLPESVQITISQYARPETATVYTDIPSINRLVDYLEGLSLAWNTSRVGVGSVGWYITVTSSGGDSTEYMTNVDDWGRETFREGHTWYESPEEQCGEWEGILQELNWNESAGGGESSLPEPPEPPDTMPMPLGRDLDAIQAYFETLPEDLDALSERGDLVLQYSRGLVTEAGLKLWANFLDVSEHGQEAAVTIVSLSPNDRIRRFYIHFNGPDYYLCVQDSVTPGEWEEYRFAKLEKETQTYQNASGEEFQKRISYHLIEPVGEGYAPTLFGVLGVAEELGDFGVDPIAEPTLDYAEIESYLRSFPDGWFVMPDMPHVMENIQGQVNDWGKQQWRDFMGSVEQGTPDCLTFIVFTEEGDPVICYTAFDGTSFLLAEDTGRDEFGAFGVRFREGVDLDTVKDHALYGEEGLN